MMKLRGSHASIDDFLVEQIIGDLERFHRIKGRPKVTPDFNTLIEVSEKNPDKNPQFKRVFHYIAFKAKDENGQKFWCVWHADAPDERRAIGNKRFAHWHGIVSADVITLNAVRRGR
jgi:inhibitor of KinA sporulation pathway (predicted exonuclease)